MVDVSEFLDSGGDARKDGEVRHTRYLVGHVLDVLKKLPDDSVHCVITSPPYWGLRDYHTEPQVWDAPTETCEHEWGTERVVKKGNAGRGRSTLVGTQTAEL